MWSLNFVFGNELLKAHVREYDIGIIIITVIVIIFIHNAITVTKRFNSTAVDMEDVFIFSAIERK
jgi:hypothetical protein